MNTPEWAYSQLDRLQGFFGRIETKASFLFAVNLGLLTSILATTPYRRAFSHHALCSGLAGLLLIASLIALFDVVIPHLRNAGQPSVHYFGDVGELTLKDFSDRVQALTDQALVDDLLCQVWRNSQIVRRKFMRTRAAFVLSAVASPLWLAGLVMATAETGKLPILH